MKNKEFQTVKDTIRTSVTKISKPTNEAVKLELLRLAHMEKMQAIAKRKNEKSKRASKNQQLTQQNVAPIDPNIYDPSRYRNKNGEYDFTTAPGYNEDVVRYNINKVLHPNGMVILAPTAQPVIVPKPKPNYVRINIEGT